jgi:hypothetical protein
VVFQDELFAGGDFRSVEGKAANYVASWNGNSWNAAGAGLPNPVGALVVHNNRLYAATLTTGSGGFPAFAAYCLGGTAWTEVSGTMRASATFMVSRAGRLYAGGSFYLTQDSTWYGLVVLEDSTWRKVPASSGTELTAAMYHGGEIYFAVQQAGRASVVLTTDLVPLWSFTSKSTGWLSGPALRAIASGRMWTRTE